MSRALRRHPVTTKPSKAARGAVRPPPRLRPTRSSPGPSGGFLASLTSWRPRFAMDIINELRKVVWPSRQDVVHLTIVVVIVSILVGAVLGGLDVGFGWLIDRALLSRNLFDNFFG